MFSLPTVFIIGAGANSELGMPTGASLKNGIANDLNFARDSNGLNRGDRDLFELLVNRFRESSERYTEGGIELSRLMNKFASIDEALHWFSSRPEVVSLGKVGIVKKILEIERGSRLFNVSDPELARDVEYPECWVPEFLSMAVGSLKREEVEKIFSRTSLVNFNYDRTVEHFLYSNLVSTFGFSRDEAKNALLNLNIIRPYGSVGQLPWQAKAASTAVPFGMNHGNNHQQLFTLTGNIRTFTEQAESQVKEQIQTTMTAARVIVLLGFGFHQQNMSILLGAKPLGKRIFATVLEIDKENHENLARNLDGVFQNNGSVRPQLLDRRCYKFLQTMRLSIMAPL